MKIIRKSIKILVITIIAILPAGCEKEETKTKVITREESIPVNAVKITPETDDYPPILHASDWAYPVPMDTLINTAGAEDSPFIPYDRDELFFFFTPDVTIPADKQILDKVTGIYVSAYKNNAWQVPARIMLQSSNKLALDGAEFVQGNFMLFTSIREGYTGIHWFSAEFSNGRWTNWQNADFDSELEVGELHIYGDELYYHSSRPGGKGQLDIWKVTRLNEEWQDPENIEPVNSSENEGWPYITSDGNELWFTRYYLGSPAVFRSVKQNGIWQEPVLIVSQFAGEPTLDKNGNLYFVHHYYKNMQMIEADLYVAYKK